MFKSLWRWVLIAATAATANAAHGQSAPSDFTTGFRYDLAGRQTGTIAPDPDGAGPLHFAAVRNTYDAQGLLIRVEKGELAAWQSEAIAPANWTGFTITSSSETSYDARGRKIKVVDLAGTATLAVTQFSYDGFDRLSCTAQRMNPAIYASLPADACTLGTSGSYGPDRITRQTYDKYGHVLKIEKAVGTSLQQDYVTYTYDSTHGDKPMSVKDANGNLATMEYGGSIFDNITKWTFPSQTTPGQVNAADYEAYIYDVNGNRTALRKRDGSTITFAYDAANRVTVKTVPERAGLAATHTRDAYFGYDLRGLQRFVRFDSASGEGLVTNYDGLGRITSSDQVLDGNTRTLSYLYDLAGNRTQMTFAGGGTVTYSYDGLNRPLLIQRAGTATLASYAYNADGQRTSFNGGFSTSYAYDTAGRLATLTNNLPASSGNNQWTFGYNPASQTVQTTRSNDAFAYTGRYNVNRNYAVNGLNQYVSAGSAGFCYDANGNLTADGTSVYLYDVENRLVERRVQGAGNTNCAALAYTGTLLATLRYDPAGRLYEVAAGSGATRFLNDGDAMVAEYSATGAMLRRYVHGADLKSDDPIAWYEGPNFDAASERFLRSDWQGSIVAVADSPGTTLLAINAYDEYGIPQGTNQGRFQYTGQAWIGELGMYYYKARIYSPTLGRFMQTDPIGYKDQVNLYAYVGNDPVDEVDFSGECPWCVGAVIGAALDAGRQVAEGMHEGKSFSDSVKSINVKSVMVAGAFGAVGGFGGGLVRAGIQGTVKSGVFKGVVLKPLERAAAASLGTIAIAAVKGPLAASQGKSATVATAVGVANSATAPVPSGTIVQQVVERAKKKDEK